MTEPRVLERQSQAPTSALELGSLYEKGTKHFPAGIQTSVPKEGALVRIRAMADKLLIWQDALVLGGTHGRRDLLLAGWGRLWCGNANVAATVPQ